MSEETAMSPGRLAGGRGGRSDTPSKAELGSSNEFLSASNKLGGGEGTVQPRLSVIYIAIKTIYQNCKILAAVSIFCRN